MITLIIFIFVLGLLIMVHELGHFLLAKKSGVRVDEFGFGFPPKLWSKKYGETTYSINLIPFGGFVKILGEDADTPLPPEEKHRALTAKPKLVQAAILVAGVFFNFLLAWFLLSIGLLSGLPVESVSAENFFGKVQNERLIITSVLKNYPAAHSGLLPGDEIISINVDNKVVNPKSTEEAIDTIKNSDKEVYFKIKRSSGGTIEERQFSVLPKKESDKVLIGITMEKIGVVKSAWYKAPYDGLKLTVYLTIETAKGLGHFFKQIFSGTSAFKSVAGPIGLFGIVGDASRLGLVYLLSFVAILSINLCIINLIPFPALDGGRLLFLGIEAIIRKPLPANLTVWANFIGFLLLISLMLVISYFDIIRMF